MKQAVVLLLAFLAVTQGSKIEAKDIRALLSGARTARLSHMFHECHSIDGVGNNLLNPLWGANGAALRRVAPPAYLDGHEEPPRESISPRAVSNIVFDQGDNDIPDPFCGSDWLWQWGQFLDHDMDLVPETEDEFAIEVPVGDEIFEGELPFGRSVAADIEPIFINMPRDQVNIVSSYIDGSMVYGSNQQRANALRSFKDGKLLTSDEGRLPPFNYPGDGGFFSNAQPTGELPNLFYICGDFRCNEQVGLAAVHTLFVREHNRLAHAIGILDPTLGDEKIYQLARKYVIAEIQSITYNEWLPLLLGDPSFANYPGYDSNVDATIINSFATAAFRVGHTMLSPNIVKRTAGGIEEAVPLEDLFFIGELSAFDIDRLLRGLGFQVSQRVDSEVVGAVRNFLFGDMDLVSLNLQRGRDHGLTDYNSLREAFDLPRVTSFADISSDLNVQGQLSLAYDNSIDLIDPFVGIMAEDPIGTSHLGELGTKILTVQFRNLQIGDRCYFENQFAGTSSLDALRNVTLADIIELNLGDQKSDKIFEDVPFASSAFLTPGCIPAYY